MRCSVKFCRDYKITKPKSEFYILAALLLLAADPIYGWVQGTIDVSDGSAVGHLVIVSLVREDPPRSSIKDLKE